MSKILRTAAAIVNWSGRAGARLCDIGLVILLTVVTYEVVARYGFNQPTVLADEVGGYSIILLAFVSGAYISQLKGHVRMEVVYERLSPKVRPFFEIVIGCSCLAWCAILFWVGTDVTVGAYQHTWRSNTVLFTPLAPIYALIPLGALLLGLQNIVEIGQQVRAILGRR